jgi:hypothetical protein
MLRNKGFNRPIVTYYKSIQELFPEGIYWNGGVQTSATTAASVFTEYSTKGIVAWQAIAHGDSIAGIGFPFFELDYKEPIEYAVVVMSSAADLDAPVYKIGFDAITFGAALPTPLTSLITTSTVTMAGAGKTAVLVWNVLPATTLKRNTLYAWGLELDDDGGASTTELYTLGLMYRGKKNICGEENN